MAAARRIGAARVAKLSRRHLRKASWAFFTAASASAGEVALYSRMAAPVAGLTTVNMLWLLRLKPHPSARSRQLVPERAPDSFYLGEFSPPLAAGGIGDEALSPGGRGRQAS